MVETAILLILLRWIHFVGAFTAIGAIFSSVMILIPVTKRLPPAVRGPLAVQLLPRMIKVQLSAALVLMAAGLGLAWILGVARADPVRGFMDVFVSSRWGQAITAGGILTLIIFFNGLVVGLPAVNSIVRLISQASSQSQPTSSGGPPVALVKLQKRLNRVIPINFVISLIVLFLMGFAAHG